MLKNGFSVIEVLVALGLASVVALGISSIISNGAKQQKGIQAKDQQRGFTSEVRTLLNNKVACFNTFGSQNPQTGFNVSAIKDGVGTGTAVYSVGGFDRTGLLTFTEFRLAGWLGDSGSAVLGSAALSIKLTKVGETGTFGILKPDIIALRIKRDGLGNITECFSVGSQSDGLWQLNPTNNSQIFYDVGNVGIGITNPNATLQVAGTITGQPAMNNATATVDFISGNLQYTNNPCAAYQLNNMKDGGTYTFLVKSGTSATCSFAAFSDAGVTPLTMHLPPDHGPTTALTHTLYSFVVAGSDVYSAWVTGY